MLITQDLCQALYQILSIISQKEFIQLNVNTDTMIKKCETCRIKYKYCNFCLEYTNFKNDLIEYKCFCCNKSYQPKFDENLKERFFNAHKFLNNDNNKFYLIASEGCLSLSIYVWLGKIEWGIITWKKFFFFSHLNVEDVADADLQIKNLGKCDDLYVQSNKLLLAGAFKNFRNISIKVHKLDPAKFLSALELA